MFPRCFKSQSAFSNETLLYLHQLCKPVPKFYGSGVQNTFLDGKVFVFSLKQIFLDKNMFEKKKNFLDKNV